MLQSADSCRFKCTPTFKLYHHRFCGLGLHPRTDTTVFRANIQKKGKYYKRKLFDTLNDALQWLIDATPDYIRMEKAELQSLNQRIILHRDEELQSSIHATKARITELEKFLSDAKLQQKIYLSSPLTQVQIEEAMRLWRMRDFSLAGRINRKREKAVKRPRGNVNIPAQRTKRRNTSKRPVYSNYEHNAEPNPFTHSPRSSAKHESEFEKRQFAPMISSPPIARSIKSEKDKSPILQFLSECPALLSESPGLSSQSPAQDLPFLPEFSSFNFEDEYNENNRVPKNTERDRSQEIRSPLEAEKNIFDLLDETISATFTDDSELAMVKKVEPHHEIGGASVDLGDIESMASQSMASGSILSIDSEGEDEDTMMETDFQSHVPEISPADSCLGSIFDLHTMFSGVRAAFAISCLQIFSRCIYNLLTGDVKGFVQRGAELFQQFGTYIEEEESVMLSKCYIKKTDHADVESLQLWNQMIQVAKVLREVEVSGIDRRSRHAELDNPEMYDVWHRGYQRTLDYLEYDTSESIEVITMSYQSPGSPINQKDMAQLVRIPRSLLDQFINGMGNVGLERKSLPSSGAYYINYRRFARPQIGLFESFGVGPNVLRKCGPDLFLYNSITGFWNTLNDNDIVQKVRYVPATTIIQEMKRYHDPENSYKLFEAELYEVLYRDLLHTPARNY